jgi:hypothetical protein
MVLRSALRTFRLLAGPPGTGHEGFLPSRGTSWEREEVGSATKSWHPSPARNPGAPGTTEPDFVLLLLIRTNVAASQTPCLHCSCSLRPTEPRTFSDNAFTNGQKRSNSNERARRYQTDRAERAHGISGGVRPRWCSFVPPRSNSFECISVRNPAQRCYCGGTRRILFG